MEHTSQSRVNVEEAAARLASMLRESAAGYQDPSRAPFEELVGTGLISVLRAFRGDLEQLDHELNRALALLTKI